MASTGNPLADAAQKLRESGEFTKSVEGTTTSRFAPKPAAKAPAVKAPEAKPKGDMNPLTGADTGKELQEKRKTVEAYRKAVPTFHKGGKIKKDGEQTISAEKGETVLPNHDVKKAAELAMDHVKGMTDGMEAASKKKPAHEAPKHHGKLHKMHHTKNTDGTWHIEHEYHPNEDGSSNPNTTHSAMDGDGLVNHVIEHAVEPNEGEPQADGGQHGVPDEHAGPAGLPLQGA